MRYIDNVHTTKQLKKYLWRTLTLKITLSSNFARWGSPVRIWSTIAAFDWLRKFRVIIPFFFFFLLDQRPQSYARDIYSFTLLGECCAQDTYFTYWIYASLCSLRGIVFVEISSFNFHLKKPMKSKELLEAGHLNSLIILTIINSLFSRR